MNFDPVVTRRHASAGSGRGENEVRAHPILGDFGKVTQ
jgi:hypothetical protein